MNCAHGPRGSLLPPKSARLKTVQQGSPELGRQVVENTQEALELVAAAADSQGAAQPPAGADAERGRGVRYVESHAAAL